MQVDDVAHGPILPRVVNLTPVATAAAIEVNSQAFAVPGVKVGDGVSVTPPALVANLALAAAFVSAVNEVTISWVNATATAKTPAPGNYVFSIVRP